MALNDKILYKKGSKSWLKNKNLSFEEAGQNPEKVKNPVGHLTHALKVRVV